MNQPGIPDEAIDTMNDYFSGQQEIIESARVQQEIADEIVRNRTDSGSSYTPEIPLVDWQLVATVGLIISIAVLGFALLIYVYKRN